MAPASGLDLVEVGAHGRMVLYFVFGLLSFHVIVHNISLRISASYREMGGDSNGESQKNGKGTGDKKLAMLGSLLQILNCQDVVVLPVATSICVFYLEACFRLWKTVDSRWFQQDTSFNYGAYLHCAFAVYEMIIYQICGKNVFIHTHIYHCDNF